MSGSGFADVVFVWTLYGQESTVIPGSGEKNMNKVVVSAFEDQATCGERLLRKCLEN